MTRRMLIAAALLAAAVPAAAQQQAVGARQVSPAEPASAPAPARLVTVTDTVRRNAGQPYNIRLDVAIIEEGGSKPVTKTRTLTVAEGSQSFLRLTPTNNIPMNLDGYAAMEKDGKIRAMMTIDYRPPRPSGLKDEDASTQSVRQSFTVLAENGRKLVVSETSDPFLDRRLRIELTATILK